jgi:hypothetical protein
MTAMVTDGIITITIRRVIHVADNTVMFVESIDMAIKCPH